MEESLFRLPGWYWYLEDEKDFRDLPNAENFLQVCLRVISKEFRIMVFLSFYLQYLNYYTIQCHQMLKINWIINHI